MRSACAREYGVLGTTDPALRGAAHQALQETQVLPTRPGPPLGQALLFHPWASARGWRATWLENRAAALLTHITSCSLGRGQRASRSRCLREPDGGPAAGRAVGSSLHLPCSTSPEAPSGMDEAPHDVLDAPRAPFALAAMPSSSRVCAWACVLVNTSSQQQHLHQQSAVSKCAALADDEALAQRHKLLTRELSRRGSRRANVWAVLAERGALAVHAQHHWRGERRRGRGRGRHQKRRCVQALRRARESVCEPRVPTAEAMQVLHRACGARRPVVPLERSLSLRRGELARNTKVERPAAA